jgi:hypothetical protein
MLEDPRGGNRSPNIRTSTKSVENLWEMTSIYQKEFITNIEIKLCLSQLLSGLGHELFSPDLMLRSWVRTQLETWMSVCVYSVYIILCVGRGLTTSRSPVQGCPNDCA